MQKNREITSYNFITLYYLKYTEYKILFKIHRI